MILNLNKIGRNNIIWFQSVIKIQKNEDKIDEIGTIFDKKLQNLLNKYDNDFLPEYSWHLT